MNRHECTHTHLSELPLHSLPPSLSLFLQLRPLYPDPLGCSLRRPQSRYFKRRSFLKRRTRARRELWLAILFVCCFYFFLHFSSLPQRRPIFLSTFFYSPFFSPLSLSLSPHNQMPGLIVNLRRLLFLRPESDACRRKEGTGKRVRGRERKGEEKAAHVNSM